MKERIGPPGLPADEPLKLFNKGEYLILAEVDCDGEPYGLPINYIVKENPDRINEKKVSFHAVCNTRILPNEFGTLYESIIVTGEAGFVEDEEEKARAFRKFLGKYASDLLAGGEEYIENIGAKAMVVKIRINHPAGKAK